MAFGWFLRVSVVIFGRFLFVYGVGERVIRAHISGQKQFARKNTITNKKGGKNKKKNMNKINFLVELQSITLNIYVYYGIG